MDIYIVFAYGLSLSMDAFAVAICKGIAIRKAKLTEALKVGLYFGMFQGLMPLIGYFLANSFRVYIEGFDHWIAFALLLYIGLKMILDSRKDEGLILDNEATSFNKMIVMSFATSIDALAVGIAFSCEGMKLHNHGRFLGIFSSCALICVITLVLAAFGVKLGKLLENKLRSRAKLWGGIVLVLLGSKILIEHLTNF